MTATDTRAHGSGAIVEPIDEATAGDFAHLAVAFGRGRLGRPLDGLIARGARLSGRPVGLFLAQPRPGAPTVATILSLYVQEDCRRRGLGALLLAAGEDAARTAGCVAMTGVMAEGSPEGPAAEALVSRAGWSRLRHVRSFFKVAYADIGHAPWVSRVQRWPAHFDVVPWRSCSDDERAGLVAAREDPGRFDPFLNPFEKESEHTPNSVALRVRGEIAGWAVSRYLHPGDPGCRIMSWTRLFVRRDLQRRGYGAMLLAEHIRRGPAAGIDYAIFSTVPTNGLMRPLVEKRLRPVARGCRDIWEVGKALAPEGAALLA